MTYLTKRAMLRKAVIRRRNLERLNSTEAVRKLGEILRLVEQSEICRDFFASKRSEGSKKRTK